MLLELDYNFKMNLTNYYILYNYLYNYQYYYIYSYNIDHNYI